MPSAGSSRKCQTERTPSLDLGQQLGAILERLGALETGRTSSVAGDAIELAPQPERPAGSQASASSTATPRSERVRPSVTVGTVSPPAPIELPAAAPAITAN